MTATGDLSEDLKGVIDQYLDGHRTRSLATLSRASSVSYTTLRRLYQREGNPTAEPVLKIVDAALNHAEKLLFIDRHYPEIATTINRFQGQAIPPQSARQETLKTFFMRDPHNFILNLTQNDVGATRATIGRLTGERGLEALDELVEHELLERNGRGDQEHFKFAPMLSHDCDMALAQMKLSADHFDRSLIGTKAARVFHATAGVNRHALDRIHDVVSAAIREVVNIKDDPRSTGEIPLFVDMMMNVYDKSGMSNSGSASSERNDP